MENFLYTEITNQVRVTVSPAHIEDGSDPDNKIFAFSYTIKIENFSQEKVQLIERHWIVNSGSMPIAEVVGPGVVGEQPMIGSGESYTYSSGAVIHDPIGSMYGSYTFRSETGKFFDVTIPKFDLHYPLIVH